jgi:hypothetical protein
MMAATQIRAPPMAGRTYKISRNRTVSTKLTEPEFAGAQDAVLAPIARGEKIGADQFHAIVKSVQSTKVEAAEEMLSRRREPREV